jgi:HEPN domain-containing protein
MSAELVIANTLRIALEDLEGARLLAASKNRNATYLLEQSAEKVIKTVLTSEGKHGGIKHHLDEMVKLIPDENPLKPALREIEDLGAFATTFRYATTSGKIPGDLSPAEFEAFAGKVQAVLVDAAKRLGVDLATAGKPARSAKPIR